MRKFESWWTQVLLTDEKKFSMDGPDGNRRQWVYRRVPKTVIPKRQAECDKMKHWFAFRYYGFSSPIEVKGKVNQVQYIKMIDEHLWHEFASAYPVTSSFSMIMHLHI